MIQYATHMYLCDSYIVLKGLLFTEQVLLQVGGQHLLPPVEDEVLLNPDQLV